MAPQTIGIARNRRGNGAPPVFWSRAKGESIRRISYEPTGASRPFGRDGPGAMHGAASPQALVTGAARDDGRGRF